MTHSHPTPASYASSGYDSPAGSSAFRSPDLRRASLTEIVQADAESREATLSLLSFTEGAVSPTAGADPQAVEAATEGAEAAAAGPIAASTAHTKPSQQPRSAEPTNPALLTNRNSVAIAGEMEDAVGKLRGSFEDSIVGAVRVRPPAGAAEPL